LYCNVTANTDNVLYSKLKPTTHLSGNQMRSLNKERKQPPQTRMSTSALQIAAHRQLEKQVKKTFTSVDGMELKSLPFFSKEYMNKKITDCDGTISIPFV